MPRMTVLLVDWPSQDVPRALLAEGFEVVSANFAAGTASAYSLAGADGEASSPDGQGETPAPDREGDAALLIRRLEATPQRVDVLAVFRPQDEHARAVRNAMDLGVRVVWVQRGTLSDEAREMAAGAGIAVIEDVSMADALQQLRSVRTSG